MSLPRLLRSSPCMRTRSLRQATAPLYSGASLLPQYYRPFSTSLPRQELALDEDAASKLPNIDPSLCEVTNSITPKALVANQDLVFGRTFTGESSTPLIESLN